MFKPETLGSISNYLKITFLKLLAEISFPDSPAGYIKGMGLVLDTVQAKFIEDWENQKTYMLGPGDKIILRIETENEYDPNSAVFSFPYEDIKLDNVLNSKDKGTVKLWFRGGPGLDPSVKKSGTLKECLDYVPSRYWSYNVPLTFSDNPKDYWALIDEVSDEFYLVHSVYFISYETTSEEFMGCNHAIPILTADNINKGILNLYGGEDPFNTDDFMVVCKGLSASPLSSEVIVGDPDNPRKFTAVVETGIPIPFSEFYEVEVGNKKADATVIKYDLFKAEQTLEITPPNQDSEGKYDFVVNVSLFDLLLNESDKLEDAVIYSTGGNIDVVEVVDRSGSMKGEKIQAAKDSAKLFVDLMTINDATGVVSYNTSASVNYGLTTITSNAAKQNAKNAIDAISAGGGTSIGSGLQAAYNELVNKGNPTHQRAIVLLSDGKHKSPPHPDDVLPDIRNANIRVFTIGLGADANASLLSHIAHDSGGGEYYYSPGSEELRAIYNAIAGVIKAESTVKTVSGSIQKGETVTQKVDIDSTINIATFTLTWASGTLNLELERPNGLKVSPIDFDVLSHTKGTTYEIYTISDPIDGEWAMRFTAPIISSRNIGTAKGNLTVFKTLSSMNETNVTENNSFTGIATPSEVDDNLSREITVLSLDTSNVKAAQAGISYTGTVTATTNLAVHMYTDKNKYSLNEPIKIIITLAEAGSPIIGADVNAVLERPDNIKESLWLYDDGKHDDGVALDGVYANYYTNTDVSGSYTLTAFASGTANTEDFTRETKKSVYVSGVSAGDISVTPLSWDIGTIPTGEDAVSAFTVTSTSTRDEFVMVSATDLTNGSGNAIESEDIISMPSTFVVPAGGSSVFYEMISVPGSAKAGYYTGCIVLTSTANSISIPISFWIGTKPNQPPVNPTLSPDKPEPQNAGTAITWTASATDLDGDLLYYRFRLKGPATGNSWQIMQDWSIDNTWTWYTSPADKGDTDISVWIRDGRHAPASGYDLEKIVYNYQIGPVTGPCKVQITSNPSLQDRPSIVYANGYYYVAYQSHEKGYGIYIKKFDSQWNFKKKVEVVSDSAYYDSPFLVFANNKLYVAYVSNEQGDTANDYVIIVKEYDPNSLTCLSGEKYLTSLQSCQDLPSLFYKNGYFYLAYQSWETGNGDIYIKKFDSNWNQLKKVRVTYETSRQDRPSLIYANGYFYIAYYSEETGYYDIFVKRLDSNLNLESWKKQITSKSSYQSYPFISFANNQFAIVYASTETGTLGIYMKTYDSNWNFNEKIKILDDNSSYERRPSMTYAQNNYWIAYVHNLVGSDDWNIFAITPGCEDGHSPTPSPTPSSSCCPSIEVTAGKSEYSPGDTAYVSISLTGGSCCFQLRAPSPVSLIAPTGETIAQKDFASTFSGSICPGTRSTFGMSLELPGDAPSGYYDVKVSLSGGECTKTVNDLFILAGGHPNQPPVNPSLASNKAEPQTAGTAITWTASATDSDGDTLYYRFWIKSPSTGDSWAMKRDWSRDNTWTWDTNSADIGDTDIAVRIRDGHHAPASSYDLEKVYYDYSITTGSASSLVAEWHFDEGSGSTVKDNSGSAEINA